MNNSQSRYVASAYTNSLVIRITLCVCTRVCVHEHVCVRQRWVITKISCHDTLYGGKLWQQENLANLLQNSYWQEENFTNLPILRLTKNFTTTLKCNFRVYHGKYEAIADDKTLNVNAIVSCMDLSLLSSYNYSYRRIIIIRNTASAYYEAHAVMWRSIG